MLILLVIGGDHYQLLAASFAAVAAWYLTVCGLVWRYTARDEPGRG